MTPLTPMQRVLKTLSFEKPDRLPLFLFLTTTGAKEMGMSIEDYYSDSTNVAEGQIRMQKKYDTDCYYAFHYAAIEHEAFGGETLFIDNGSPNSRKPILKSAEDIYKLRLPNIKSSKPLNKVLDTIRLLQEHSKNEIPIIGVVMSPFSLPAMQLGFEKYFEIMHFDTKAFEKLIQINEAFCIEYANAQIKAGATAICYFDPVASTTIVPRKTYKTTGHQIAQRVIKQINGPVAMHFASGNSLGITDLISDTGVNAVCVSNNESMKAQIDAYKNKQTVIGNINGLQMVNWTPEEASKNIRELIQQSDGETFIISDNHGEIPFQVTSETLLAISETVKKYGSFH